MWFMRLALIPLLLLTGACRQEAAVTEPEAQQEKAGVLTVYAGSGRDRLCYNSETKRMSVIAFGPSQTNCTMRGSFDGNSLRPDGDGKCQVPVAIEEGQITLIDDGGQSCAYYCGPGASYAGKTFVRMDKPDQVADLAGDPLC
jgi:hypothetical protein